MAGILIIAHAPLASALRDCATHVFGGPVPGVVALDVCASEVPAECVDRAAAQLRALLDDNGALILTDVLGASPANLATLVARSPEFSDRVRLLAGVNLPMLLRGIAYRSQPLDALAEKTQTGGAQGVVAIPTTAPTTAPSSTH